MNYSRKKAFVIIALSTLLVSGSSSLALLFFHFQKKWQGDSPRYHIQNIIQASSRYEALKTVCLAEMLELSKDKVVNIEDYDTAQGEEKLLSNHVIEKAKIRKMKPSTLFIEYELRKPFACFSELSNTYVDSSGYLFPAYPYFTPKKLPELYIGKNGLRWGDRIHPEKLEIIRALLKEFKGFRLTRVDLSHMEGSLGKKEIVVCIRLKHGEHLLRLPTIGFDKAIRNYLALYAQVLVKEQKSTIVDLRLKDMAFLQ